MIEQLHIRNFAIIDDLKLNFKPGLTIITGETGSGKSIILQALAVSLGMKPTRTMVKSDSDRATVETNINNAEQQLTLYRIIPSKGRIKNYVNDEPVNEKLFKQTAAPVADFHGQHEQQLIMDQATHINYLDDFAGTGTTVAELNIVYRDLENSRIRLQHLIEKLSQARDRADLLEFQLKEIAAVDPVTGEDITLNEEYSRLSHAEEMISSIATLNDQLISGENALIPGLQQALKLLERLGKFDSGMHQFAQMISEAVIILQDADNSLRIHSQGLDSDNERLLELQDRIQAIETLKRKYGGALEAVLEYRNSNQLELDELEQLEDKIITQKQQIARLQGKFQAQADKLHKKRIDTAPRLSMAIEAEMHKLNMLGGRFEIRISQAADDQSAILFENNPVKINPGGYDVVQFYLSANPGEKLKPMDQIASGGEISRIMLAIKTILQASDPVEILIFDEIDTGISGSAAEKVADSLVNLARNKQVICITHLPQIARRAQQHLEVEKKLTATATDVKVRYLDKRDSAAAVARLVAGESKSKDEVVLTQA